MKTSDRFVHVILTRFNCRFKGGDFRTRSQPQWLEHRFGLFERYCLPTLKSQTSTNFEWILFFDSETPAEYLDRARALLTNHPNFHLHLTELYSGEWLIDHLKSHLLGRCDWLLSTRLDNDDGLNKHFVEYLQQNLRHGSTEALNFPKGLILSDERLYVSRQSSNAFLSVSEPFDGFRTALHAPHKDMGRHMPLRDIEAEAMWLQVIHEANVSNKRRGHRVMRKDAPSGFHAVAELATFNGRESPLGVAAENLTLSLMWNARDRAIEKLRRLRLS